MMAGAMATKTAHTGQSSREEACNLFQVHTRINRNALPASAEQCPFDVKNSTPGSCNA